MREDKIFTEEKIVINDQVLKIEEPSKVEDFPLDEHAQKWMELVKPMNDSKTSRKMKKTIINEIICSGEFLNLPDLPHNCIFNKVRTGCGGTSIALMNSENYVIAVPYTELIINKLGRTDAGISVWKFGEIEQSVFGLFGNFGECKTDFQDFVSTPGIKKIMCTYDKLSVLEEIIDPAQYRLLVDEYQQLLMAYSYRQKTIDYVLKTFRNYKSFCFMSATPIQPDFRPDCLADVDEVKIEWDNKEKLRVYLVPSDKPYKLAANVINRYMMQGYIEIDGKRSEEAFFFINSVTDISRILNHCQLKPEDVKIVCSEKERNIRRLKGYQIENSRTPSKKITFLTSKSFEGSDYFSETGIAFVVSSGKNENTLLGIDTDIPQIAGRIRNTCFKNFVVHFILPNIGSYYKVPYSTFKKNQMAGIRGAKEVVDSLNNLSEAGKNVARNGLLNNKSYIQFDEGTGLYSFNDRIPKLEMYIYQIHHDVYKSAVSLKKHYMSLGVDVSLCKSNGFAQDITQACQLPSFKEVYLAYSDFKHKHSNIGAVSEAIQKQLDLQPLVKDAYRLLGDDEVRRLRYSKSKIQDALEAIDESKNQDDKIMSILERKLESGFYSSEDLKKLLGDAYDVVGRSQTAKAEDIRRWYEVTPKIKRIKSKSVRGFVIIKPKYVYDSSIAYT